MGNNEIIMKMQEHCQNIQKLTAGFDFQQFVTAPGIKEACVLLLLQIGELGIRVDAAFKVEYKNIPWMKMRGFRNRLVHDYGNVDFEVVWNTIQKDVPELVVTLNKVLKTGGVE